MVDKSTWTGGVSRAMRGAAWGDGMTPPPDPVPTISADGSTMSLVVPPDPRAIASSKPAGQPAAKAAAAESDLGLYEPPTGHRRSRTVLLGLGLAAALCILLPAILAILVHQP